MTKDMYGDKVNRPTGLSVHAINRALKCRAKLFQSLMTGCVGATAPTIYSEEAGLFSPKCETSQQERNRNQEPSYPVLM